MKIAIVHEMLVKLGGAEKVVENWALSYPDADIFTLIYDEKRVGKIFPKNKIHPQVFSLRTQKVYKLFQKQRLCLPFMTQAIESLNLSEYDAVLVSSSGFAHGIITKPEAKTITYYHSPARYLWDWTNEYKKDIGANKGLKGYLLGKLFLKLRQWDYIASMRCDVTLANSKNTARRIQKYYRKDSEILYPPIETERFAKTLQHTKKSPYDSFYIILSALTEFKRLDVAIVGFKELSNINLVIIGAGDYQESLQGLAKGATNITFAGAQFGDNLVSLVQNSSGLIFPGEEDFGIVPIEVMAAGKPVFALEKGGLTETVIAGKTGDFFQNDDGSDFVPKMKNFHKNNLAGKYSQDICKKQAKKFSETIFENKIRELID